MAGYLTCFRGVPLSFQADAWIVPPVRPRPEGRLQELVQALSDPSLISAGETVPENGLVWGVRQVFRTEIDNLNGIEWGCDNCWSIFYLQCSFRQVARRFLLWSAILSRKILCSFNVIMSVVINKFQHEMVLCLHHCSLCVNLCPEYGKPFSAANLGESRIVCTPLSLSVLPTLLAVK